MPISDGREIEDILLSVKTIALLGASPKPERPSNSVMHFLLLKNYHVIPVNPGQAGKEIHGQRVVASLADIDMPIDMVEVFRSSEHLPSIIEEMLALKVKPKILWTQLGVVHPEAAKLAERSGIRVVMNRCPVIELTRLM